MLVGLTERTSMKPRHNRLFPPQRHKLPCGCVQPVSSSCKAMSMMTRNFRKSTRSWQRTTSRMMTLSYIVVEKMYALKFATQWSQKKTTIKLLTLPRIACFALTIPPTSCSGPWNHPDTSGRTWQFCCETAFPKKTQVAWRWCRTNWHTLGERRHGFHLNQTSKSICWLTCAGSGTLVFGWKVAASDWAWVGAAVKNIQRVLPFFFFFSWGVWARSEGCMAFFGFPKLVSDWGLLASSPASLRTSRIGTFLEWQKMKGKTERGLPGVWKVHRHGGDQFLVRA